MNYQLLKNILSTLDQDHQSTLYDLMVQTLRSSDPALERHRESLLERIPDVLDLLSEKSAEQVEASAIRVATATYWDEVQNLIHPHTGFHFKGTSTCLPQLENFSIAQMGQTIQKIAPNLWNLLGVLLDANSLSRRRAAPEELHGLDEDVEMELGDIATAAFGNDEGSEWSGAEDEDDNGDGDIAPYIAMSVDNVNDGADEAANDEAEMARANDSGDGVADEPAEHDSKDGHAGPQQKRHYRKQNPGKRNAALLFIVSQIRLTVRQASHPYVRNVSLSL
jgi:hypothetical protein